MIDTPRVIRILIIEDSEDDAELLVLALRRAGYTVMAKRVETSPQMEAALDTDVWDVVVSDFNLPHFSALGALSALHERNLDLPFIIVSGAIGEEVAVICMKAGAHDYVMKDSLARLTPAIEREIREAGERAERRRAEEALLHLALHDSLTGLPNRTLLQDRLEQAILANARDGRRLAVMLIDLDRFKEVNDAFGHLHGDRLLQQIGPRLQAVVKASDTIARLGGDEFAVVLPACGETSNAQVIASRLAEALEQPFAIEGQTLRVAGSIGIVMCPDHGTSFETLMRCADTAMYNAKREGEGFCLYTAEQDQNTASRLTLGEQLREAIECDELVPFYQPKVDLMTGELVGVEALARWQHRDRGLVTADNFIPLAEQTGLIKPLSAWMLNAVMKQASQWRSAGLDVAIAVNLSMRNLHDPQLPDQVAELLRSWQLPAECLQAEITETVLMSNPPRAMEVVTRLNRMGVHLSIDDFGTGYSSLAYLKRLPVREIKIDKSFVRDMVRDENDAVIVRSTVDLGHNLGLKVVAEGVETQQAWDQLLALGCDAAQGFYMGMPMPAAELESWLDRRSAPVESPRRAAAVAPV